MPFKATIGGAIGEDDGRAVAAAVESESRFRLAERAAPSLFVDWDMALLPECFGSAEVLSMS